MEYTTKKVYDWSTYIYKQRALKVDQNTHCCTTVACPLLNTLPKFTVDLVSKTQHWKRFVCTTIEKCCYVRGFKENIHILYIKLKENKFPIQILLPSEYLFILFQAK